MKSEMSSRELNNAKLSQKVAEQGIVLLQNKNNVLPLHNKKVALYGSGAFETYKGGTGSGDVNQRSVVSILDGLEKHGFEVSSKGWLNRFKQSYLKNKSQYYQKFAGSPLAVLAPAFSMDDPEISDFSRATIGIYVVSRSSGEGQDRKNEKGDYQLTENELANIQSMSQFYRYSIVLLNVGGVIDTSFVDSCPLLDSVVLVSQPGMEAGNAIANVLDGTVTPSGKLTDTWAYNFEDYYSSNSFGQKNPNYQEGIYVGYRYFDSFNVEPRYEFGYGLSYTKFYLNATKVKVSESQISVDVNVHNIGDDHRGSEVVQVYVSNPQTDIPTPYQSLQGFKKTKVLHSDESQDLNITIPTKNLASYDEKKSALVLVPGVYIIRMGNSSRNTKVVGEFRLDEEVIVQQLSAKIVPEKDPTILRSNNVKLERTVGVPYLLLKAANFEDTETVKYHDENEVSSYINAERELPGNGKKQKILRTNNYNGRKLIDVFKNRIAMTEFIATLTDEELVNLDEGILRPEDMGSIVGNAAGLVHGAAGETFSNERRGIPATVNADGPAGLRLDKHYKDESGQVHNQYATAWPIGTMLAQTWDTGLVGSLGKAVGIEMKEFGVTMWLAPGMNIHRNPLGGRNFEYYSEDPVLSGMISAAEVSGVQSNSGVGATIKHFLGNNQETDRNTGNSIIGEQALREIYLKNFQIAIEASQPMAVMSSYNKVNGTFSGENYELLTNILRDEWHFEGLVMTDWFSLADPVASMHAGNDLIMPGVSQDKLLAAISDLEPEFNDDGSIKTRDIFDIASMKPRTVDLWNDFDPDVSGTDFVKIHIAQAENMSDDLQAMILSGEAQIVTPNDLIITGNWKDNNNLYIGDLQKSAMHILKVVMKTDRFAELISESPQPYNADMKLNKYFE
ncbi:glycoside hydrolase family 3 C-terminal domain-containing protein [Companilactobacillus mishanensis]|uniref:glycoside hydrolase family 3 C-terminal domain-containing protein n=1 Tax=Companilactobacillus mishanensis TaxID=2486008 RepID=UPI001296D46C|nr:glycoside hydrolase family 3 N-terminal domain-containing protein [Companilactobacillus mishanensis]MQS88838.1 glycoside hydrolase family 3 [Companilactobacillus mishanensis]